MFSLEYCVLHFYSYHNHPHLWRVVLWFYLPLALSSIWMFRCLPVCTYLYTTLPDTIEHWVCFSDILADSGRVLISIWLIARPVWWLVYPWCYHRICRVLMLHVVLYNYFTKFIFIRGGLLQLFIFLEFVTCSLV